jgi:hypothetical protein
VPGLSDRHRAGILAETMKSQCQLVARELTGFYVAGGWIVEAVSKM